MTFFLLRKHDQFHVGVHEKLEIGGYVICINYDEKVWFSFYNLSIIGLFTKVEKAVLQCPIRSLLQKFSNPFGLKTLVHFLMIWFRLRFWLQFENYVGLL